MSYINIELQDFKIPLEALIGFKDIGIKKNQDPKLEF